MNFTRYARLSKAEGDSIERQLLDGAAFILQRDGTLADQSYAEPEGISGARYGKRADGSSRRPEWDRMLADARAKKFDAVVMLSPDRGSRTKRLFDGGKAFADLHDTGCQVFFLDWGAEPLKLDSELDYLMFTIRLFGAAAYRSSGQDKSARVKRSLAAAGFSVGVRIYGYATQPTTDDPEHKKARYVVDEVQAAVVRRVFSLAEQGYGNARISRTLNHEGIASPSKKGWSKAIIGQMLARETYSTGVFYIGTTKVVDTPEGGQKRMDVPKDDWIKVPVPAIIKADVFARVQRHKAKMAAQYGRTADGQIHAKPEVVLAAKYLLNGFGKCPTCGGPVSNMKKNKTPRYYCTARQNGRPCTNGHGYNVRVYDAAVVEHVNGLLLAPENHEKFWTLLTERVARYNAERAALAAQGDERATLEAEGARLEKAVANLLDAIETGAAVGPRLKDREAELTAVRAKLAADEPLTVDFTEAHLRFKAIGPLMAGDAVQGRMVMRKLGITSIVLRDNEVEINGNLLPIVFGDLPAVTGKVGGGRRGPLRGSHAFCWIALSTRSGRSGALRTRAPVAAKMALLRAGAIVVTPGSPTPVG